MSYLILDGKLIASKIRKEIKQEVDQLRSEGITPGLVIILVGSHSASEVYVRGKIRASQEVGIQSKLIRFAESISEEDLLLKVNELNLDPAIHGILVQLPLPQHISTDQVVRTISYQKDVDGFHPYNMGRLVIGQDSFIPCTPLGIMELLKRSHIPIMGKHAVVIGRSNIVGKPISTLLQQANATVTICHSRTDDLSFYTRQADLLIVAIGKEKMITADYVKKGSVVIDVGIHRNSEGKIVGDVDFSDVAPLTSAITPVPKGVGPMTITMLLANTVQAAKKLGSGLEC